MQKLLFILGFFMAIPMAPLWAGSFCGDEGLTCDTDERCCEHTIAMFAGDQASMPSYIKGQCIPQENKCSDFWCGNRQCKSGFFGSPSVCCVYTPQGGQPDYACAYSERNCRGNANELTIRGKQSARKPNNY